MKLFKIIALCSFFTSCGMPIKVSGGTTNRVEGRVEGEVKYIYAIDISGCTQFKTEEAQYKCLDIMEKALEQLNKMKDDEAGEVTDESTP